MKNKYGCFWGNETKGSLSNSEDFWTDRSSVNYSEMSQKANLRNTKGELVISVRFYYYAR